jgi:hypothetical protein
MRKQVVYELLDRSIGLAKEEAKDECRQVLQQLQRYICEAYPAAHSRKQINALVHNTFKNAFPSAATTYADLPWPTLLSYECVRQLPEDKAALKQKQWLDVEQKHDDVLHVNCADVERSVHAWR